MRLFPVLICLVLVVFRNDSHAQSPSQSFDSQYEALLSQYSTDLGFDYLSVDSASVNTIYNLLYADMLQEMVTRNDLDHTLINIYNFLVIKKVLENYPISSVAEVPGFFTDQMQINGYAISLDKLEDHILHKADDPYIHFLLNCGAKGCGALMYVPEEVALSDLYTTALRNERVVNFNENELQVSKVFFWDQASFGNKEKVVSDLSEFLQKEITHTGPLKYLDYDWILNDINDNRSGTYYPTKLYRRGGGELKIFNNNYTQSENGFRSNFFSSFFQLLIGTNKNINWGFDIKFRSVNQGDVTMFSALKFQNSEISDGQISPYFARAGISGIGPRIKYQPFAKHNNINFLHTIYFVPMSSAEGNAQYGYSDYNNMQIFNQMFYEKEINSRQRLFIDLGLHIENIKLGVHRNEEHFTPIQVPVTAIYSFFPTVESTIYGLASFGQRVDLVFAPDQDTQKRYSVYGQIGMGAKYFLTDFLEAELLYTRFLDRTPGRTAHTFNLGLRFFKF